MRQVIRLFLLLGLLAAAPPGHAQEATPAPEAEATTPQPAPAEAQEGPDYAAWEAVAARAEAALEAGRASDQALLDLRAELVEWRTQFADVAGQNDVRINTLKTQIATLGPPPEEGQVEPAVLTERREELSQQLAEAEAPLKTAEEAEARADALVAEIDNILRTRQTDQLFELGPTPLNPASWVSALDELWSSLRLAWREVEEGWGSDIQRGELARDWPLVVVFAVVGLVLLLRGRAWVIRFGAGIRARAHGHARGVWGFVLSLGQVVAPLVGVLALVAALLMTGVLGLRGLVLVVGLPQLGLAVFTAAWLGNRVFGVGSGTWSILNLEAHERKEGRLDATLLGLFYGVFTLLQGLAHYENWPEQSRVALSFPLLLGAGLMLVRLGLLLRQHARRADQASDAGTFLNRVLALVGRLVILVGVLGPLSAAIGYSALAESFLFQTGLTLALVGGLAVLHRFFTSLYGLVLGLDEAAAADALMPVLASFVTFLFSLPVLALIWGARLVDLQELWGQFRDGVVIGNTRISATEFFAFLVVFAIGYALTRLIQGLLRTTVLPKTNLDIGGRNAITAGVGYLGIFLAAVVAITSAGIDLSSLAIVAGALSVGIGFGLQNVVSNFVSGIILLIERPISQGDWIEVGGKQGYVRDISVRSTTIETFDRTDVIVPNADLVSGQVTNYTRGNLIGRVIVPVGVAYGTDTRKVEKILREIAEAHPLVTVNPAPGVVFQGFGADALEFEIRAILKDVNFILSVKSDLNHEIARRFTEEGIEIPFAQRDIWLRNPEALAGMAGQGGPAGQGGQSRAGPPDVADLHGEEQSPEEGDSDG